MLLISKFKQLKITWEGVKFALACKIAQEDKIARRHFGTRG